jgi:fused signal recognition particle receptor
VEEGANKGFFRGLRDGLKKTRDGFVRRLDRLLRGKVRLEGATLEAFEELLLTADLGVQTTTQLIEGVERRIRRAQKDEPDVLRQYVREGILEILKRREAPFVIGPARPFVVMAIGVNGVGKTTTIAKLASQWKDRGLKVVMVAGDTFRAAAIEQLQIWGERVGVEVLRQQHGADPSAVVYDALQAARARQVDLVIVDTAGRLHTKVNLMDELKKIQRVSGKVLEGAPHEVLLVIDATTGQNALSQARMFHEAVGVTGMVLTKLDGTAKGGILVALASEMEIPVRYIGVGEGVEDLQAFEAEAFVEALFGEPGRA